MESKYKLLKYKYNNTKNQLGGNNIYNIIGCTTFIYYNKILNRSILLLGDIHFDNYSISISNYKEKVDLYYYLYNKLFIYLIYIDVIDKEFINEIPINEYLESLIDIEKEITNEILKKDIDELIKIENKEEKDKYIVYQKSKYTNLIEKIIDNLIKLLNSNFKNNDIIEHEFLYKLSKIKCIDIFSEFINKEKIIDTTFNDKNKLDYLTMIEYVFYSYKYITRKDYITNIRLHNCDIRTAKDITNVGFSKKINLFICNLFIDVLKIYCLNS
jgi:hypothetical protein